GSSSGTGGYVATTEGTSLHDHECAVRTYLDFSPGCSALCAARPRHPLARRSWSPVQTNPSYAFRTGNRNRGRGDDRGRRHLILESGPVERRTQPAWHQLTHRHRGPTSHR